MPKPTKGPRLGAGPAHERKILSGLAKSLIEHGAIVTTEAKAKRLQPYVEKLITKARKGDIHNRRMVARKIGTSVSKYERGFDAVYTLFDVVAPQIDPERQGGYTRIVKMPPRRGDSAPMAQISLVLEKVEKKAQVKTEAASDSKEEPKVAAEEAQEEKLQADQEADQTAEEAAEEAADQETKAEEAEA